jgi:hypothetical protein
VQPVLVTVSSNPFPAVAIFRGVENAQALSVEYSRRVRTVYVVSIRAESNKLSVSPHRLPIGTGAPQRDSVNAMPFIAGSSRIAILRGLGHFYV